MSARRRSRPSRIWDLTERKAVVAVAERLTRVRVKRFRRHCIARCISRIWNVRVAPRRNRSTSWARSRVGDTHHAADRLACTWPSTHRRHQRSYAQSSLNMAFLSAQRSTIRSSRSPCGLSCTTLNLMDPVTVTTLELRDADLKADWEGGQAEYLAGTAPMPATQLRALAAHESGLCAGIKYPSARTDLGVNLVVFPDRLDAGRGDRLEVVDGSWPSG